MNNQEQFERLEKNIDKLNYLLSKNKLIELSEIIGNWKKLIWRIMKI